MTARLSPASFDSHIKAVADIVLLDNLFRIVLGESKRFNSLFLLWRDDSGISAVFDRKVYPGLLNVEHKDLAYAIRLGYREDQQSKGAAATVECFR